MRSRRAFWTATLSFGLVHIPVKLYNAVKSQRPRFHLVHERDQAARGYEAGANRLVIVHPQEREAVSPRARRTIELLDFVSLRDIDALYFQHPYYVVPHAGSATPYSLLLEAMRSTKKIGIATLVSRNRHYLAALRPLRRLLCLETMRFADEVLDPETLGQLPPEPPVDARELVMAEQMIQALSTPFVPEKHRDDYREAVLQLIRKKAEGQTPSPAPSSAPTAPDVPTLLSTLQASLEQIYASKKAAAGERLGRRLAEGAARIGEVEVERLEIRALQRAV